LLTRVQQPAETPRSKWADRRISPTFVVEWTFCKLSTMTPQGLSTGRLDTHPVVAIPIATSGKAIFNIFLSLCSFRLRLRIGGLNIGYRGSVAFVIDLVVLIGEEARRASHDDAIESVT
jgi:hypothetical protein